MVQGAAFERRPLRRAAGAKLEAMLLLAAAAFYRRATRSGAFLS
jgi:hypothetical protein